MYEIVRYVGVFKDAFSIYFFVSGFYKTALCQIENPSSNLCKFCVNLLQWSLFDWFTVNVIDLS